MKYYIASSFANIARVRSLNQRLSAIGHSVTYDWTKNERTTSIAELSRIAQLEKAAVIESDVFIMLLPAGRGSHIEYGMALASNKPIILYSPRDEVLDTTFYHMPNVQIITGNEKNLLGAIVATVK
ncbi:hypothetical protein [Shouchella patagoniensis]|uniref:hypothetical protein n=1 Tax=Shouchella patagoniensis TaxID=228576 RepID=UPI000994C747|nr:hypothetical protein [Shouchella patagoniensis]